MLVHLDNVLWRELQRREEVSEPREMSPGGGQSGRLKWAA